MNPSKALSSASKLPPMISVKPLEQEIELSKVEEILTPAIPEIIENDLFEVFKEMNTFIKTSSMLSVDRALGAISKEF